MTDEGLFASHEARHDRLETLAADILKLASLLQLHAWYAQGTDRGDVLAAAAADADDAAMILRGEKGNND